MIKETSFWDEPVGRLPLQKPATVVESTSIRTVLKKMQRARTGCVFVTKDRGDLTGIFTERDVMQKFIGTDVSDQSPISELMTPEPLIIDPSTTVAAAVEIAGKHQYRHFPVGDNLYEMDGLLSVRTLVDFVAENMPGEILNLPPDSTIMARNIEGG